MRLRELKKKFNNYELRGVVLDGVCFVEVRDSFGGFVGLKSLTDLRSQLN